MTKEQQRICQLENCIEAFKEYDKKRKQYVNNILDRMHMLEKKLRTQKALYKDLLDIVYDVKNIPEGYPKPNYYSQLLLKIEQLNSCLLISKAFLDNENGLDELKQLIHSSKEAKSIVQLKYINDKYSLLNSFLKERYPEIRKEFKTYKTLHK